MKTLILIIGSTQKIFALKVPRCVVAYKVETLPATGEQSFKNSKLWAVLEGKRSKSERYKVTLRALSESDATPNALPAVKRSVTGEGFTWSYMDFGGFTAPPASATERVEFEIARLDDGSWIIDVSEATMVPLIGGINTRTGAPDLFKAQGLIIGSTLQDAIRAETGGRS